MLTNWKASTWPLARTVCAGKNIVDWSLLSTGGTGYSGMILPVLSKILSGKKRNAYEECVIIYYTVKPVFHLANLFARTEKKAI